jgi:hypothetical protein
MEPCSICESIIDVIKPMCCGENHPLCRECIRRVEKCPFCRREKMDIDNINTLAKKMIYKYDMKIFKWNQSVEYCEIKHYYNTFILTNDLVKWKIIRKKMKQYSIDVFEENERIKNRFERDMKTYRDNFLRDIDFQGYSGLVYHNLATIILSYY